MTEKEYLQAIKSDVDNPQPTYYSLLFASVRYSNEISDFEKILFSDILALTNTKGFCFATNNYFAKAFNKSKDTISRSINNLKKAGFIDTELIYKNSSKEIVGRIITIIAIDTRQSNDNNMSIAIDENTETPIDENTETPIGKKAEDNNINNNNTSVNGEVAPTRIDFEIENRYQPSLDVKKYTSTYKNWDTASFEKCILYWISKLTANTPTSLEMILSEHERMRLKNNFENRNSNCGIAILEAVDYAFKFDVRFRLKNFIDFLNINLLEPSKSLDMSRQSEGQDVGYKFDYCLI